jgi:hypothetical protein
MRTVRVAGGSVVAVVAIPVISPASGQLDAAHVLSPSPWSEQSLADALSSPSLTPGL